MSPPCTIRSDTVPCTPTSGGCRSFYSARRRPAIATPLKAHEKGASKPAAPGRHPSFRRLSVAKVGGTNNESGDVLFDRRAFLSCARRRLNCRSSDNSYGWTGGREKRLKRLGLPAGRVRGGRRRSRLLSGS